MIFIWHSRKHLLRFLREPILLILLSPCCCLWSKIAFAQHIRKYAQIESKPKKKTHLIAWNTRHWYRCGCHINITINFRYVIWETICTAATTIATTAVVTFLRWTFFHFQLPLLMYQSSNYQWQAQQHSNRHRYKQVQEELLLVFYTANVWHDIKEQEKNNKKKR